MKKETAGFIVSMGIVIVLALFFPEIDFEKFLSANELISGTISQHETSPSSQGKKQDPQVAGVTQTFQPFYDVVKITDGDTIKVMIDGKIETVRLANMNTPESVDPRRPVECLGKEASAKMAELVTGKKVSLEPDTTQANKDRYERLLRFVFLEDGTDVGLEMIRQGYAQSSPYGKTPHIYLQEYIKAQKTAQNNEVGLWDPNSCLSANVL